MAGPIVISAGDHTQEAAHRPEERGTGTVSVVVPVYRGEDFLPRCVESVLAQTYRNLELILVDDGSPDHCGDICDRYAAADPRVVVIHQSNGGPSRARNRGIDVARGDYIAFIDADDWVAETYLERLVDLLEQKGGDIAVAGFRRVREGCAGESVGWSASSQLSRSEALTALYGPLGELMMVAWGKLYRRALLGNIRFPVGRMHEDVVASCHILVAARFVVLTAEPLYFYRQWGDSIMGRVRLGSFVSLQASLDGFLDNSALLHGVGLEGHRVLAVKRAVEYYCDFVRGHHPSAIGGPDGWTREAARRCRHLLAHELGRCSGHRFLRCFLSLKLRCPRAVGVVSDGVGRFVRR